MSNGQGSVNSRSWTGDEEEKEDPHPLTKEERRKAAQREGRRIGRRLRPYVRPIILPFIVLIRSFKSPFLWFLVLITIGAVSAGIFGLWTSSYCGKVEIENASQQNAAQAETESNSSDLFGFRAINPKADKYNASGGEQLHTSDEGPAWGTRFLCEIKVSDLVTIWLTWCLVIVGAFQAWWLFGTLAATEKAASAAHNDQRPWIEMIVTPVSLIRDEKGIKLSLQLQVENVGHTPATAVFHHSELLLSVVGEKGNSLADADKAFRKTFDLATKMKFGNPLFPGRKKTLPVSHRIEEKDLAPRLALDAPDGRYTFHLGAGISYPFAGGIGETTALFVVWKKGEPVAFRARDTNLEAEEIRFIEMPLWNTAK